MNRHKRQVGIKEARMRFRFLPLKETKTRGAASGSWIINGFPRTRPDSARRACTVHRASSCMVDQTSSRAHTKSQTSAEPKGPQTPGRAEVDL
ncbi:hypothetical protein EYF80_044078 [Liparis tanakae]|uniref:Uncharacterized protein n=1 Tax=Liparis tanakae TaxID=230148 RepID=A0A4Z2FWW7_9TELE|nr:hypothetical protein EYF80_044078 [Liparis tanakae]